MELSVNFALVGPGRAGTAMTEALARAGWHPTRIAGRSPDAPSVARVAHQFGAEAVAVEDAGVDVSLVLIATPDAAIRETAERLAGSLRRSAIVAHLAGSVGLDVFTGLVAARPDVNVAAIHPLQTLPGRPDDSARLVGSWFAVEGPPEVGLIVEAVGGRAFAVEDRAQYHAAACVASNHFVALMGQVERLATAAGVPPEAFAPLVAATLANVSSAGVADSLTGPVARGDLATVQRHLDAIPDDERGAYRALAREALRLTGRVDPALESILAEPLAQPLADPIAGEAAR